MSEISYNIITFWVFKEETLEMINEKCRELEDEYDVTIHYESGKKTFELKGTDHDNLDKTRDILFKLLMTKTDKQAYGVPRYPKKEKFEVENCAPGLPPSEEEIIREHIPLMTSGDDSEEIEIISRFGSPLTPSQFSEMFQWDKQEPYHHWHDICRDCNVIGDIYDDEMKVVFTRGELEDVELAKRRLRQLQKNILRPKLENKRVPLIHYTNVQSVFKLCFCEPSKHPYFRTVRVSDFGNTYILAPLFSSNPNYQRLNEENKRALSNRIRDHNFTIMRNLFSQGLEYTRVHKGEIRFSGRLGKVMFTNVNEAVKKKLWDFADLKNAVSENGVVPRFNDIATCEYNIVEGFHETFKQNYTEMVEFYEMIADARYGSTGNLTEVHMIVNKSASLRKVVSKWEPVVSLDWTILDRNSDLSICLATRRFIRSDIKPFKPFANHITLDPKKPSWILFKDFSSSHSLIVKSIYFKSAKRYSFGTSIAEVTRVEKLVINDSTTAKGMKVGKVRYDSEKNPDPEIHYTIEIYNEEHEEIFKENLSLGSGEVVDWTTDRIIGEHPDCHILFGFVKAMLFLVTTQ